MKISWKKVLKKLVQNGALENPGSDKDKDAK